MKKLLITFLVIAFIVGAGALGAYIYRTKKKNGRKKIIKKEEK